MSKVNDLTNMEFGDLVVVGRAENNSRNRACWVCACKCGSITVVSGSDLLSGNTKSCGCRRKKHGFSRTRLHKIWLCMKNRCYYHNHDQYSNYGCRGIAVCDEWKNNFIAFMNWALASGYNDNLTIDRIDVDGNYEPSNCRWITNKEQQNNRRNNHMISFNGKTQSLTKWAEEFGIKSRTLSQRINGMHWSIEKALTTPVK